MFIGVFSRDLHTMRSSVAYDSDDTARRRIQYNFQWFNDLLDDLYDLRENPKYLATLQKLFGEFNGLPSLILYHDLLH